MFLTTSVILLFASRLSGKSRVEPQVSAGDLKADWNAGRCTVPPFSLEELKEVIVMPTMQEVLIFDPPELVDEIVGDVVQSPGALSLLAYALSELYEAYRASGRRDRALRKTDYERLGGVMGALRSKADNLYQTLEPAQQATMRKIMLRMVSVEGDLAGPPRRDGRPRLLDRRGFTSANRHRTARSRRG